MAILDELDLSADQKPKIRSNKKYVQYFEFIMHVKYGVSSVMYNRVNKDNQSL